MCIYIYIYSSGELSGTPRIASRRSPGLSVVYSYDNTIDDNTTTTNNNNNNNHHSNNTPNPINYDSTTNDNNNDGHNANIVTITTIIMIINIIITLLIIMITVSPPSARGPYRFEVPAETDSRYLGAKDCNSQIQ